MRWLRRLLALVALAALVVVGLSVRVLDERQVAFRTLLGDPDPWLFPWMRSELPGPAVYLKLPLLHAVDVYDQRIKRFESAKRELPMDQEPIEIGYFVIWRIGNVRLMRENLLPSQIVPLIDDKTYSAVRNELALHRVADLLSPERAAIVERIREASRGELARLGIEVLGIGISDVEYPDKNLENVFARMREGRVRLAKRLRAEGEEGARNIRADADRDVRVELARAEKQAAALRGEGDARAADIYAQAYDQEREFYDFVRSLEAYRKSLDEQTTLVLSPEDPFLKYFFGGGVPGGNGKPVTR
jgi:modulator of FtsH protease HflC